MSVCAVSKKVRDSDPYIYMSGTDEEKEIERKIQRNQDRERQLKETVFDI